jgi:chemotaxis protein MotB
MIPARIPARRGPAFLRETTSHRDRWVFSYTDIVTILLILFVAAAAHISQDRRPNPAPAPAAAEAPKPAAAPDSLSPARDALAGRGIDLRMEERGLVITLPQAVLFDSGDDRVRASALSLVARIAEVLRGIDNKVLLVGHADAKPVHNRRFRNNWELSAARGMRLLETLTGRFGIPEARLAVASYGAYAPTGPNDTPGGRAANRRVEIVILRDPSPR